MGGGGRASERASRRPGPSAHPLECRPGPFDWLSSAGVSFHGSSLRCSLSLAGWSGAFGEGAARLASSGIAACLTLPAGPGSREAPSPLCRDPSELLRGVPWVSPAGTPDWRAMSQHSMNFLLVPIPEYPLLECAPNKVLKLVVLGGSGVGKTGKCPGSSHTPPRPKEGWAFLPSPAAPPALAPSNQLRSRPLLC